MGHKWNTLQYLKIIEYIWDILFIGRKKEGIEQSSKCASFVFLAYMYVCMYTLCVCIYYKWNMFLYALYISWQVQKKLTIVVTSEKQKNFTV